MVQATFVAFQLGSPDWTVRLNTYTVHIVPARIMQQLEQNGPKPHSNQNMDILIINQDFT